jgi:hypothetical protein
MNLETFKKIFAQEFDKFQQERNQDKDSLEKFADDVPHDEQLVPTFEEDPIGFILYSYPTLKETLETLLTKDFLDYITGIYIIAPIPTTFKVILHNNQFFYMIYMGRTWIAKVSGKKYYLLNIGERGRAIDAIARLLMMGAPLGTEPNGETNENTSNASPEPLSGGGTEAGGNPFAAGAEETPAETPAGEEETNAPLKESKNQKKSILLELKNKFPHTFRTLVSQILLTEASMNTNSGKVVQRIISSPENAEYGFTVMKKSNRVGNLNQVPKEKFEELLHKLYPDADIQIIPPKVEPNVGNFGSSKYSMYSFNTEYGPVGIVLAAGANKGEKYEKEFLLALKEAAGKEKRDIKNPEMIQLFDYLELNSEEITPDDVRQTGTGNNKRQLSFDGPEDIGEKIADITIDAPNTTYYLSIKDPKGTGIYNGGNVKFVKDSPDGPVFDQESFVKDNSLTKELFEMLSINPQRIADGLKDYINKTGNGESWEDIQDYDDTALVNLLASSYGYGYYYVRQTKPGNLKIKDLESPEDTYSFVGSIKSVKIKYANKSTKSTEVRIETNSQDLGDNIYVISIRNAAGSLLPIGLKIQTLK